jgi:predicted lysophospholipase L1 biosynthesis ABC-type transport system permease subunit
VYTSDVQAVNRVPVVTLWTAAGLLALAAVAILGQALAREMLARGDDFPTLRALGMSRGSLMAVSMAKAVLVGAGGAAMAVGVAVLASPLMPLGLARIAEPDPGFSTDWLVLGIGAAATLFVVSAVSVLPAHRAARRGGDRARR